MNLKVNSNHIPYMSIYDTASYSITSSPVSAGSYNESPDLVLNLRILQELHGNEIYLQHCMSASLCQMSADSKSLTFLVIA